MSNNDYFEVFNCEMSFRCPKNWYSMQETADSQIRNCQECKREVYFARTKDKAQKFADEGKCVAFYEFSKFAIPTAGIVAPKTAPNDQNMPKRATNDLEKIVNFYKTARMISKAVKFILIGFVILIAYGIFRYLF